MCGIVGIVNYKNGSDFATLKAMCGKLASRGPDDEGYFQSGLIGLGHRRLSIIDITNGHQPMKSADKSVVIVYNGEIYNFQELRSELQAYGYRFTTNSDTEVLINGYLAWGIEKILNKVEGMFAFALYDILKNEFFLARDKFGEKPVYYSYTPDEFIFASELKAFEPNLNKYSLDKKALNYFLTLTYIPAPYSIYQEIKKLEAGHYIIIKGNNPPHKVKYWDFKKFLEQIEPITNFTEAKRKVRDLVTQSVKERMISDVPLGAFLSGGIDSSIVSSLLSHLSAEPVNTFTIGFKEKTYDESKRAKLLAQSINSNHNLQILDYKDIVKHVEEIIQHFDEPFGDSSALPSFFVAKLAAKSVRVVLTGDCSDEVFGGYEKYLGSFYSNKLNQLPLPARSALKWVVGHIPHNRITNVWLRKFKKVIDSAGMESFDLHYHLMSLGFKDEERRDLLINENYTDIKKEVAEIYHQFDGLSPLAQSQATDIKIVLEGDMFVKVDRVCMKNSIESRSPFIDSKVLALAMSLPDEFKIKGRNTKYILKEAFSDILPKKTLNFRKKGFGVPLEYWFKNELKSDLEGLINFEFIKKQGIFNYAYVKRLFDEHQSGKDNHKSKLWNLYVFQKWYKNNTQPE